jgi:hypothetical protein
MDVAPGVAPSTGALSSLLVHFGEGRGNEATWRLGVNAQLPVADPNWGAAHDALLLDVLQQVGALGGLPHGLAARNVDQWAATGAVLQSVKERVQTSGLSISRGKGHNCSPGFDCSGCRQVRLTACQGTSRLTFDSPVCRFTPHSACSSGCLTM